MHAALLIHAAKKEISESNVLSVVKAAGLTEDAAKAKALIAALEGVNIEEAIKSAALPVAAPAAAPAAGEKKKEEKKDEKKSEEEASAGLANLFG
ncbi:MAG: 50S ribosomal protein P1 [Candidatus Micrarchaeota archaeon]